MATNGLTITGGSADLELSDGVNSYGFLTTAANILETRGSAFAGAVSSGAPTYADSSPYKRAAWESFSGGFGQVQQNNVFGGLSGQGGDPSRFYWSDGYTLHGGTIMPGMARNLIYPQAAGKASTVADTWEVPKGVMPSTYHTGGSFVAAQDTFTVSANTTIQDIWILVRYNKPTSINLSATITGTPTATFTVTVVNTIVASNIGEWRWAKLHTAAAITLLAGNNYTITVNWFDDSCAIGTFIKSGTNQHAPYFQLVNSATNLSYKCWSNGVIRFEAVNNSGTVNVLGLTPNSYFNTTTPATAERASPGGTYAGSIVFDNKVYIGYTGWGTGMLSAADAAAVNAFTATSNVWAMGPAVEHEGKVYFIDGSTFRKVSKFDGDVTVAPTDIIAQDKIGKASVNGRNNLNNILIYRGFLYLFKPEGVFMVYLDPSQISTTISPQPRIIKILDLSDTEDLYNGKWATEFQGSLFFNVLNKIYQLNVSDAGNEVKVISPPLGFGRFGGSNYVNGLTHDGETLFISYNNIGVLGYRNGSFHNVTDTYNYNVSLGTGSGLKIVPSVANTTNALYVADIWQAVRVNLPSYFAPITNQLYQSDLNQSFYWISSFFDADLADIQKFWHSLTLRAFSGNMNYKAVLAYYQGSSTYPNYRTLVEEAFHTGLRKDRWYTPTLPTNATPQVQTTLVGTSTQSPAYWTGPDFLNATSSSEKGVAVDDVSAPIVTVNASIILYGWYNGSSQYSTSYEDIGYVESLVLKYLPTLRYVPIYRFTLNLQGLMNELKDGFRTNLQTFFDTIKFLRDRARNLTPTLFTFQDPITAPTTGTPHPLKQVRGFIQNPQFEFDALLTAKKTQQVPELFHLTIISMDEE